MDVIKEMFNKTGLISNLYTLLWKKLPDTIEQNQFEFMVPNTIIYRNNEPFQWFYSTVKGILLKKKAEHINNDFIIKEILKSPSKSGIGIDFNILFKNSLTINNNNKKKIAGLFMHEDGNKLLLN